MIKVGLLGHGKFGKKIESKLLKISNIQLVRTYTSSNDWWDVKDNLDWIIISTPNEFHYEQAKHFLERNINVFCEKPGTLSTTSLQELIDISKKKQCKILC